ncbi:adenosylmethionine decarboxylase [Noviherbaspirillum denitrificans]|uniref:S-adenosylmethionine decarboxylase proenzyme n=1 Tax=Noviherbaspirillum denitrificans TaxID=1968433 RepID=A0A254TKE0_9BURK|nr:adenosylmethionine decarboxylase [Noviherbaspirillum denitrificans]OWW22677.1 S-adenosylmethionine decarboxylase proenzyme [Noviherbaspirillum denitrificans]
MSAHHSSGVHLIADLHGVAGGGLADPAAMEQVLREAALAAGAHIVYSHFHPFGPGQGVTGVVLLAESHISIHTWPESGFAAVDIFMCGNAEPQRALDLIRNALAPTAINVRNIARGTPE